MENTPRDPFQQNPKAEPQRPPATVLAVQLAHLPIGQPIAARDLPQACDSWHHLEPVKLPVVIFVEFVWERRSRGNQAHFSSPHRVKQPQNPERQPPPPPPPAPDALVLPE